MWRLKRRLLAIAGMILAGTVATVCGTVAKRLGIEEQIAAPMMTISFFIAIVIGAVAYDRSWFD
jgi:hypothetical protein